MRSGLLLLAIVNMSLEPDEELAPIGYRPLGAAYAPTRQRSVYQPEIHDVFGAEDADLDGDELAAVAASSSSSFVSSLHDQKLQHLQSADDVSRGAAAAAGGFPARASEPLRTLNSSAVAPDDHDIDRSIPSNLRDRMLQRLESDDMPSDGRGHHSVRGTKLGYEQEAYLHLQKIDDGLFGRPCLASCPFERKCGFNINPANLTSAHVWMYGDKTTFQDGTYACAHGFQQVKDRRRDLVLASVSKDSKTGATVERFMVDSIGPVCAEFCRAAYGIPVWSWKRGIYYSSTRQRSKRRAKS